MLQSLFYLTTALRVLGVTITHHQHKTTATIASGICHTVTAICRYRGRVGTEFQLFHDSGRQQYGVMVNRCYSYNCFVLLKMGDADARNM
jgi:hypothetical protein